MAVWLLAFRVFAGETASAVATVTGGFVTGITVTSGGSGYTSEPSVTIQGGSGSGATARAFLNGDQVALIVVLTAGSGYSGSPTVTIAAPPNELGVRVELVPKLTVEGPVGIHARVERANVLEGPWTGWSNVVVGAEGTVLVDLSPGSTERFYRVVTAPFGFVWIPPGTFVMGSPGTEPGRETNEVQRTVTLTKGFWLSDHEVTQAEYQTVMGVNPSNFVSPDYPVERVSWHDAVEYCTKLTERERVAGRIPAQQAYRLPTEAEWEYAARAGTTSARHGILDLSAWHSGNSGRQTRPVKGKNPNDWGVYDMIGNVWEWCADWYSDYSTESVTDPKGPASGAFRVGRGGSWYDTDNAYLRSAVRGKVEPGYRNSNLGFRPVLGPVQ